MQKQKKKQMVGMKTLIQIEDHQNYYLVMK